MPRLNIPIAFVIGAAALLVSCARDHSGEPMGAKPIPIESEVTISFEGRVDAAPSAADEALRKALECGIDAPLRVNELRDASIAFYAAQQRWPADKGELESFINTSHLAADLRPYRQISFQEIDGERVRMVFTLAPVSAVASAARGTLIFHAPPTSPQKISDAAVR